MRGLQVLYEDNHLIAVNKPAGVLVQGDDTGDRPLGEFVKDYIKDRYKKPGAVFLGIIHRLDRPVSGVTIFARTSKALTRMNQLFKDRKIQKLYWAISANRPDPLSGRLVHYIEKDRHKNFAHAYAKPKGDAKRSELEYTLLAAIGTHNLIEVKPKTGRPHQIRVQLARHGNPIRGDIKYGFPNPNPDGCINLHCRALSFEHPVKKEPVTITATPDEEDEIWKLFREQWI